MGHYGILHETQVGEIGEDIRGAHLYGLNDEKLGKIDDVIFDHSTGNIGYIVVDAGGWLKSKKFIVPAERLRASAKHENDFEVDLNSEQVKSFPPYRESDLESENKWSDYEGRYRSKWVSSPVMHRAETDRNITPTAQQTLGNVSSERAEAEAHGRPVNMRTNRSDAEASASDLDAAYRPTERIVPPGTDSVVIDNTAMGIGARWDTFQSHLRERRKEVVAGCKTCTGESATKRGSDSAGTLRKAV